LSEGNPALRCVKKHTQTTYDMQWIRPWYQHDMVDTVVYALCITYL
jgi:hypothetical protein